MSWTCHFALVRSVGCATVRVGVRQFDNVALNSGIRRAGLPLLLLHLMLPSSMTVHLAYNFPDKIEPLFRIKSLQSYGEEIRILSQNLHMRDGKCEQIVRKIVSEDA